MFPAAMVCGVRLHMTLCGERGAIIVEQNKQARHVGCHRHLPHLCGWQYVAGKMKKPCIYPAIHKVIRGFQELLGRVKKLFDVLNLNIVICFISINYQYVIGCRSCGESSVDTVSDTFS
jgi:hypothetical protein